MTDSEENTLSSEQDAENSVDINTDDLDAFSRLLTGQAKQKEVATEKSEDSSDEEVSEKEDAATQTTDEETSEEDVDSLEEESEEEGSPEEEEEKLEEKKEKPKNRFQERINELTAKAREAERESEALKRKLDEVLSSLEDKKETKKSSASPTESLELDAPTPQDVDEKGEDKYPLREFDPLYIRDLTRFTIKKEAEAERLAAEKAAQEEQAEAQKAALVSEWSVKFSAARERIEDLEEKSSSLEKVFEKLEPTYGEYLASTIMSLDAGPDVLYYLANNLSEAERIISSGPTKATIALGRLEARFLKNEDESSKEKDQAIKKVSKAPVPPPKNKGSSVKVADDSENLEVFEKKFFLKKS